ncbi:MAG: hypothetical protein U9Q68_03430 [Euryarchaeota archaeon]|nr:hypothetical protein [Euryarchaeota archaeon]
MRIMIPENLTKRVPIDLTLVIALTLACITISSGRLKRCAHVN